MTMTTPTQGSTKYSMESDMESLSPLLQEAALESPASAGSLRLTFYKMEDGSVTWLLKNQTDVLLWA